MIKSIIDNISKMKEISTKISTLVSEIENTPEHLLPFEFNQQNDSLHNLIIKLYSQLTEYHRQSSRLYSMPINFPRTASRLTAIQEIRNDYIRIKMPLLYRKNKEDSILADDLDMAFFDVLKSGAKIPAIEKKEIAITYYYKSNTLKNLIRDNDNYAIKRVINTIVRYLQSTDSGDTTWLSIKTILSDVEENYTIIEVKRLE